VNLVGTGPEEEKLKTLAMELGVADRIRFLGRFAREDALALVAEGGVFAQISLFEGHSLALIEAAKLGMPLIVSNVPAQIEGVTSAKGTRCGIVVETDAAAELAQEVLRLLDDPEHQELWAARARLLAADTTYETMMTDYLDLVSL
jgi:glycosyltransferase involved in cell wall biosynthesis